MKTLMFGAGRPAPERDQRRFGRGLLVGACMALSGCSASPALQSFDLSSPVGGYGAGAARGLLVIAEPQATAPTDGDRIVVRPTPDTLATLAGAQWVERLPRLLQTRMVQAFENARLVKSVGRPENRIQADFSLSSEIRRFEIDVGGGEAVVEISTKLVAEKSGRIVAAQIFSSRVPFSNQALASAGSGAEAALSLDAALAGALRQIVGWTTQRM